MQNRLTNGFLAKCWLAVRGSEQLALSQAEQRFYTAVHLAVMAYEDSFGASADRTAVHDL